MSVRIAVTCPHCAKVLDSHEHVGRSDVTPDTETATSVAICSSCREPAIFARSPLGVLTLRAPDDAEYREILSTRLYVPRWRR